MATPHAPLDLLMLTGPSNPLDLLVTDMGAIPYANIFTTIREKQPCVVNYAGGKATFTRPYQFFWPPRERSPSDSTWMVPGTHE